MEVVREINKRLLVLKQGDITKEDVDVIVNAAAPHLMGGGGVDGAIHKAAGPSLKEECKKIRQILKRELKHGEAVVTTAGNLKANYIIHTPGPIWKGGKENEDKILKDSYKNSLLLAEEKKQRSIAFPSISTGAYGYPLKEASLVALKTVIWFLKNKANFIQEVRFVLFDEKTAKVYAESLEELL